MLTYTKDLHGDGDGGRNPAESARNQREYCVALLREYRGDGIFLLRENPRGVFGKRCFSLKCLTVDENPTA